MRNRGALGVGVSVGLLLTFLASVFPDPARAAWVTGTAFTVGGNLRTIIPNIIGTTGFLDPTCGSQGGTSLALVPGSKLVPEVPYRIVLVVSCLDVSTTVHRRLNYINPADGKVIKQISTTTSSSRGWQHFLYRPDKGDLLGCADNGDLYSITLAGTATPLPKVADSCTGLAWDAEADMIYQGLSVSGNKVGRVVRFKDGTTSLLGDFTNLPCPGNGLTISGGVLLMSCEGSLTLYRLNKDNGVRLGVHGQLTATAPALSNDPGLGDLACDPVTFHKDAAGRDLFRDAMWSRRGANGNGVVALEFPAFTCGMPSSSVVVHPTLGPISPLAAGLSAPNSTSGQPGAVPLAACFDASGIVIDVDRDGLPDCWEGTSPSRGIDFSGRGVVDFRLCVPVDTNGDGIPDTTECADPTHRDLFVEIDWMQDHKPDPKALSQTLSVASAGVKSVREAFAAAPVQNPLSSAVPSTGIRIHFQVDEQVTFTPHAGGATTSHVNQVAFTPCTGPASLALNTAQAVDFDVVKAANFGTAAERGSASSANILNAKRLAFRYVLFAHNVVGSPGGGSSGSGCAEVGGDDAVVTLGSFATTTVDGVSHGRGTTDQQAGTFMHELGHTLGLRHGGIDGNNCKPNYRSVMSYTRQFAGSPIANRRLDYSRSKDPDLNELSLNEFNALGSDPSLGPIITYFPTADQIAFGPGAWSLVTPAPQGIAVPVNWDRSMQGKSPSFQTNATGDINAGATTGCDGVGTVLLGHDDWSNILYRSSAAIDFAGGGRSESPVGSAKTEMTSDDEERAALLRDVDINGAGDGIDCGGTVINGIPGFPCEHRIDIKPSFPLPKIINPGTEANITIAIFSERNGTQVWNAPQQVVLNQLEKFPLTFRVESFEAPVKANQKSEGTCSVSDAEDPRSLQKDGIKDLKCQFPTSVNGLRVPSGTHYGVVSGFFFDPLETNPHVSQFKAFSARQLITIVD